MNRTQKQHLVMTKLHAPENPYFLVTRQRLYGRLSEALRCKLTAIVAPPGYGKSTLVGSWLRSLQVRFGWVSLDKGENDRLRFWTYAAEALNRPIPVMNGLEQEQDERSLTASPFTAEMASAWLMARLSDDTESTVLVLDDYHMIESEQIHTDLYKWINRLPAHVQVCILSRSDIPFPVAAMRANGYLYEMGISELRFTEDEIAAFWSGRTGAKPGAALLQQLSRRTEGWAAMLQLAAMSRPDDRPEVVHPLSGRHRHVADYMMEEVFAKLDEGLKRFLVSTSILERMNDALCSAVFVDREATADLCELERRGLLLIALDHERCWYRYHHLFADFLRSRLSVTGVDVSVLHKRAALWYEAHGYMAEAIHHALEAGAFGEAAVWLERHAVLWLKRRETTTLLDWLNRLPEEAAERPMILLLRVWTELMAGHHKRAHSRIDGLKASLRQLEKAGEHSLLTRLREEVQIVDNYCAVLSGDYARSLMLIGQLGERDELPSENASVMISHGIELNEGTVPFIRGKFGFDGRLGHAEAYHRLYGTFLVKNDLREFPYTAYQQAAMSEPLYEQNKLEAANEAAQEAVRLGWTFGVLGAYVPAVICAADIRWAQGSADDARVAIDMALANLADRHMHTTHWYDKMTAKRVRKSIALGETEAARSWMDYWRDKSPTGTSPLTDYERLTCIKALISLGELEEAGTYADQLLRDSRSHGQLMSELHALLLNAEIGLLQRQSETSDMHLQAALRIGEADGYFRSFLDAGPIVLEALAAISGSEEEMAEKLSGTAPAYVRSIVAASGIGTGMAETFAAPSAECSDTLRPDALTSREKEVLRLMAQGLSNKEIAALLVVTEGTVKLHLHHIYGKLEASGRVQAIRAAERLGLLGANKST